MEEKKILVVDDEAGILHLFEAAFSNDGCTVRTANSAEKQLEILKNENIQVMFFDLNLPDSSGICCFKKD